MPEDATPRMPIGVQVTPTGLERLSRLRRPPNVPADCSVGWMLSQQLSEPVLQTSRLVGDARVAATTVRMMRARVNMVTGFLDMRV